MMCDITESCLDRPGFMAVQKELQKGGWISQKYIHRLAMAVCCCRKSLKGTQYDFDRDRLLCVKAFLYELLKEDSHGFDTHCSPALRSYILNCLQEVSVTDYSRCQFLDILYQAKHGKLQALNRECGRSESQANVTNELTENDAPKRKKMTKTQIECMLRKRKRKMAIHVIKLMMFPGNFPRLKSDADVIELGKRKDCFVEPHDLWNNKSFNNNSKITYVKVWTNQTQTLDKVKQSLMTKAAAIQREMDKMYQTQLEKRREQRRQHLEWKKYVADMDRLWQDERVYVDNRKEIMKDDYDKKNWKSKQRPQKITSSVLDNGHCLHCHKEFTSLKDKTPCRHHSGYIVNKTWKCCGELISKNTSKTKNPVYVEHQSTSCVEVPTHVWRAHARSDHKDRKAGANSVVERN